MAMDQHQTFNWLVNEKNRLESEVFILRADRNRWIEKAFDLAFKYAKDNPAIKGQIEHERKNETITADTLDFVLR